MNRGTKRALVTIGIFAFAGWMVYEGLQGWLVEEMPMHYVGYFLAAVGVLAMCGVNIWRGGPLDPRND